MQNIIEDFARCQASALYLVKGKKLTYCQLTLGFQKVGFLNLNIEVE